MWIIWISLATNGRRQWYPTPVLLPGKSHGRRSLVGCSPWVRKELDMTESLHFHFSLSCTGEGNGGPLQYSCLENPRMGAWWAAVYGVTQSWTRLTWLSSSSSSSYKWHKKLFIWRIGSKSLNKGLWLVVYTLMSIKFMIYKVQSFWLVM